jgi:serine protease Do
MNEMSTPPGDRRGLLSKRRIALLATTLAGLGAGAVVLESGLPSHHFAVSSPALAQNLSQQAQSVPKPVGFADVVEKVKPAVISVRVKVGGPQVSSLDDGESPFRQGSPLERFFRQFGNPDGRQFGMPDGMTPNQPRAPRGRNFVTGQGSGFFISADGYAVTNNHVVDKAETVEVVAEDGKTYSAKVIGTDPRTDLALIKVDGGSFPFVKLADGHPRIGDWVLAVGNPFGLGGTVTAGIVSARGRDIGAGPYDDFIQIDAPVNKGNSGGPTFDVDGNVIGVNTAIFSPSGGNVGIAFAIPAETVKTVVAQLRDKGTVSRGWIGVQIQPVTKDIADSLGLDKAEGALVAEPQANSPAVKAGIQSGDVITSINGERVKDAREVARRIGALAPGASVKLGLFQKGAEKTVTVTLGELPNTQQAKAGGEDREKGGDEGRLGLTLAPAGSVAGAGAQGVIVTNVAPNGPAADLGFQTGDVILEVAGKAVSSPADVRSALDEVRKGGKRTVLMRVKSGESTKFVAAPVGRG